MTWQQIAGLVITGAGVIGTHTWLIRYWVTSRGSWTRTEAGRFMWAQPAGWAALFDVAFLNRAVGDYPGHDVLILLLYAVLVAIGAFWPHRLLSLANREAKEGIENEAR